MSMFHGIALSQTPGTLSEAERAELHAVLHFLRPKPCPVPLTRIGGDGDGAYLVPADLEGIEACFSPGVSNTKGFEDELCRTHGIGSHMCDFSSDLHLLRTPLIEGRQTFAKKWLDVDGGPDSVSLEDWVAELAPGGGDLILQIDIEGAEYRNLLRTPREVLRRFRIIVMELHGLGGLNQPAIFRDALGPFFRTLERDFVSVHAHPNNCAPQVAVEGLRVPQVLELTLLRRDRVERTPAAARLAPLLPHPLDVGRNVRSRPPEFLDEAWLDGPRPVEAELKRLQDELDFWREKRFSEAELNEMERAVRQALSGLLARSSVPAGPPVPGPSPQWDLPEVAAGKPFWLDAAFGQGPERGVVAHRDPFFFHTAIKAAPRITIDLLRPHDIRAIVVTNRGDGRLPERASGLFAVLHDAPEPEAGTALPFALDEDFLTGRVAEATLGLAGLRARHVTLTSPLRTALHFSNIGVFGTPADD